MTRFLKWRKMTWALFLWVAVVGVWIASTASTLSFMAGAFGLIILSAIWFMSRPPWSQGHGLRLRRVLPVDVPFKSVKGVGSSPS